MKSCTGRTLHGGSVEWVNSITQYCIKTAENLDNFVSAQKGSVELHRDSRVQFMVCVAYIAEIYVIKT